MSAVIWIVKFVFSILVLFVIEKLWNGLKALVRTHRHKHIKIVAYNKV